MRLPDAATGATREDYSAAVHPKTNVDHGLERGSDLGGPIWAGPIPLERRPRQFRFSCCVLGWTIDKFNFDSDLVPPRN